MKSFRKITSFLLAFAAVFMCLTLGACGDSGTHSFPAKGVDLSSWQKEVDFSKLKDQGISFVILRAGTSKGQDKKFEKYYREAKSAGLDIGCYFYTYALDNASAEQDAQMLLKWLRKKKLSYPVYLDVEDDSILSVSLAQRTGICERFRESLEEEKYLVGLYANENWIAHHLDMSALGGKYEMWMAKWTESGKDDADMSGSCRIWQYTDSGKVEGVSTAVDLNVCYFDYPGYIRSKGLNNYPEKTSDVTEALKIGEIWNAPQQSDSLFMTSPTEDGALIGTIEKNSEVCVLEKKNVGGALWGRIVFKGVKGWMSLENAHPISKASVFLLSSGSCSIDEGSKRMFGLNGSVENLLSNVFASNLGIRFENKGEDKKLGFVYDGYTLEEFVLS